MKIELRPIDDTNQEAVESLEVSEDQKQYIASNKDSLATAVSEEYKDIARPFAICADGKVIGFTMFAFELTSSDPEDRYWLWRLMIDKASQRQGYGTAAMKKIIEYFRSHGADHMMLSTKESNAAALALYHRYQFAETGEMNEEEIVLRLKL